MSISVKCNECGKSLKAPDSAAGKKAKCPQCGAVVKVPEQVYEAEEIEEEQPAADEEDPFGGINPYESPALEEKRKPCPVCGEMIVAGAAKCRYCGEVFDAKLKRSGGKGGKSKSSRRSSSALAGPGQRFTGAFLDGLAAIVLLVPGIVLAIGSNPDAVQRGGPNPMAAIGGLLILGGVLVLLVLQMFLLITRSQSIGKYFAKTQIMDFETEERASFMRCVILRGFVNGLIGAIPFVGPIYTLVDPLFVFSDDHRCLHDRLAGTYVVDIS